MIVIKAQSAGFCFGVSRALGILDKELEKKDLPGRLLTLGPIIHNPLVMDEYARKGVICAEEVSEIKAQDHVVIRAHGIPVDTEKKLVEKGVTLVDATCPKVKKAQLAIAEQSAKGGYLLLFGEKNHPEVKGLVSYAANNAYVFSSMEDLLAIPLSKDQIYFLAAQTTQDKEKFIQLQKSITDVLGYSPVALNTICNATKKRQEEVIAIAKDVDLMVIVGGLNSGNTRRLVDVTLANKIPAVHVESLKSMKVDDIKGFTKVGLTAGASTPAKYIDEMENFLLSYT